MIRTPSERFWSKVDTAGDCWLWTAKQLPRNVVTDSEGPGYGRFWLPPRFVMAHRFAYEEIYGPIPSGLVIDHLCRTRNCVRPDHLEPVTLAENIRRGSGWAGRKPPKTECLRGHPLTPETTYINRKGRTCKVCQAARYRAKRSQPMPNVRTSVGRRGRTGGR